MRRTICIDIETPHRDPIANPWLDDIYMCGIWDGEKYTCVRSAIGMQWLLRNDYYDCDIVGHNTIFDLKFLKVRGWMEERDFTGRILHDTKIIGSLLKQRVPKAFLDQYEIMRKEVNKSLPTGISHREGKFLSLKVMAPWYLKIPPFWETPGDHNNEEYNQLDCMYTYRLYQLLGERLQSEGSWDFYVKKMLEWSKMVMEIEIKGISMDNAELDAVEKEYLEKRDHLKNKLDELWGKAHAEYYHGQVEALKYTYDSMLQLRLKKAKDKEKTVHRYQILFNQARLKIEAKINYASPIQMSWLLKDFLGLDIVNADGDESTGKAVLHRLAIDREDIKTYLEWREADKVLTMYVPTYRELQIDGLIHPSFNLTGTRTGRTSSSGPNLQQVPAKLYRLFKPRSGHSFLQYDLSGIEAALIALYSGDKTLFDILAKGESIHDHNAKAMFDLGCSIAEVSLSYPKERKIVKNIGFACFYGAGWRRISQVFAAGGFPISDAQAKEKLKLLKSYYPKVFEFHKEITEVFEAGETIRNLFGRPLSLQDHDNKYMTGFNTLIQSSASDLNLYAAEKYWKAGGNPLLLVHDFILAEEPNVAADLWAKNLQSAMTDFDLQSEHGKIQIRTEGEVNDHWVA